MGGGWELWGALIVGAAIWILGQLLKQGAEDPSRRRQQPQPAPEERAQGRARERTRRPLNSSEMERFLQEMNRRRQEAEKRARTQESVSKTPARQRPPEPRPAKPSRSMPADELRTVAVPVLDVLPAEPTPKALPVAQLVPAQGVPVLEVVPADRSVPTAGYFPPAKDRPLPPTLIQLAAILHSREKLRANFMLREVLGAPVCQRGRRGKGR